MQESEDGKKLNDMEFFQLTHSSAKKGWVVEAEEKYVTKIWCLFVISFLFFLQYINTLCHYYMG